MPHDYYFVPLLLDARDAAEPEQALRDAFDTILDLGRQPAYQHSFAQFLQFMEEVGRSTGQQVETDRQLASLLADELIIALATDTRQSTEQDKATLRERVLSRADWREKYERILADLQGGQDVPWPVEVIVARDGVEFPSLLFSRAGVTQRIGHVVSGRYSLKFSTGRVLWAGELRKADVEWTSAFPGRALDLAAADAGTPQAEPSREIGLLGGEVVVRIFPGLEAGVMTITVNG